MTQEMRRYASPGKYEGGLHIDQYVHELTLHGCDDEVGRVEYVAWYGLLRGFNVDYSMSDFTTSTLADMNDAEKDFLRNQAGAIVQEDQQGFVVVTYYATERELDKAWQDTVAQADESDDD